MFGMRPTELIIILFITLLLFGGNRLPELAGSLGKAMKDFRRAVNGPDEPVSSDQVSNKELVQTEANCRLLKEG